MKFGGLILSSLWALGAYARFEDCQGEAAQMLTVCRQTCQKALTLYPRNLAWDECENTASAHKAMKIFKDSGRHQALQDFVRCAGDYQKMSNACCTREFGEINADTARSLSALKSRFDGIERDRQGLETDRAALKKRRAELEARLTELNNERAALEASLQSLRDKVGGIEGRLPAMADETHLLDTQMAPLRDKEKLHSGMRSACEKNFVDALGREP